MLLCLSYDIQIGHFSFLLQFLKTIDPIQAFNQNIDGFFSFQSVHKIAKQNINYQKEVYGRKEFYP